jgi:hypothetical protein
MAKCFIHGADLIVHSYIKGEASKSACLKIYRDSDKKELSIAFDNSLGAFGDECRRIEACVFDKGLGSDPEQTINIANSNDLAKCIVDFILG